MSVDQLLQGLTQFFYIVIASIVIRRALSGRRRLDIDMAFFFGVSAFLIIESRVLAILDLSIEPWLGQLNSVLLMALPYLLLRLVADFATVPRLIKHGAEIGLALSALAIFTVNPLPLSFTFLMVVYFVGLQLYAALRFLRQSRRSTGITMRRMLAAAAGSVFLALTILMAGLQAGFPQAASVWRSLGNLFALGSALSYFFGFTPPHALRRFWQAPELHAFLSRAVSLPRLPQTRQVIEELETRIAQTFGAPHALIWQWDEDQQRLRALIQGEVVEATPGQLVAGRAFQTQHPLFSTDVRYYTNPHSHLIKDWEVEAVIAAPISVGEQRLGALSIYSRKAPLFSDSDLELVQLLADQTAIILESHSLIQTANAVQVREAAARLKGEFLAAAAHDLRTPVTALLGQVQLLERRAQRDPSAPANLETIQRIVQQTKRLTRLLNELLDVNRLEYGQLVGEREPVDLSNLVRDVCHEARWERHTCVVDTDEGVIGEFDRLRITQLLENLLDNAIKYSPQGGEVKVRVWREPGTAHITVSDQGIGIPATDIPDLFKRFQRGGNIDARRFTGLGLGLYICRSIAEQHGGHIWVESLGEGQGSTFHVTLPLTIGELAPASS